MGYIGNRKDREERFQENKLINLNTVIGYGIKRKTDGVFMGFNTNKGLVSVWNEARKAKLAFAYHTNNTIDERANDYEVVPVQEEKIHHG